MTVKAAEQAQERSPRLIMVLESTTEPLQWTRALSLPQPERRSGRKRCVAGNDLPTMRMQRRRERRKSAEGESTEDNDSNPNQKIQDSVLKGCPSYAGPRSRKDWVISTFPHGETDWGEMSRQFAIRFGVT